MKKSILTISNLELSVFCGCYESEHKEPADVFVTIEIEFENLAACVSDSLSDAICYSSLIDYIRERTENKHYKLIEHLAEIILDKTKLFIKEKKTKAKISVLVEKKSTHIRGLESAKFKVIDAI